MNHFAYDAPLPPAQGPITLYGDEQDNELNGSSYNDKLYGYGGNDRLNGGRGDDTLVGGPGADYLFGGEGNDVLIGESGAAGEAGKHDIFDGGTGIDTVMYALKGSELSFWRQDDGMLIATRTADGADAYDSFISVERVLFQDGARAFGGDTSAAAVYRLYQAAFDRTPDPAGLGYWIAMTDQGESTLAVAASFIKSAEFIAQYGANASNAELVDKTYKNVLHRAPDAAGAAYWTGHLDQGDVSRAEILKQFSDSHEYVEAVAPVIALGFDYLPFL